MQKSAHTIACLDDVLLLFKEDKRKLEVTADFNRLSVMFMRLDETLGIKTARKVSTATMSCARLQASIGMYFQNLAWIVQV